MSFLFPLYLLGAAAIAIPILLHLRRRPPTDHVTFSSLMFLEKSPERLTRRTRIERWLLLALRCLALILLAFMFGRPFLKSKELGGGGDSRRIVILVDRSASMRREDLWRQAVEKAAAVAGESGRDDVVTAAWFDDRFEVVREFGPEFSGSAAARADSLKKELEKLGPGWRATDLGKALTEAADLAGDAPENSGRRFAETVITVISDFQEGAGLKTLNQYAWPEEVAVRCLGVGPKDSGNLAIDLVASPAPEGGPDDAGEKFRRRVRLSNARDSVNEDFSLGWLGQDGKVKDRMTGKLPPGASRVLVAPERPDDASDGVLALGGDAHDFDNRLFVARAQPREVRILFLSKDEKPDDVGSPLFYLARAMHLTATIDPSVRAMDFAKPAGEIEKAMAGSQVVVFHGNPGGDAAAGLSKFAESGGLVIGIVSADTEPAALETILGAAGVGVSEAEVKDYAMLAQLDFEHPVLRPFAMAKVRDFTKVRTWKYRKLTLPESIEDRARVFGRFDSGDPAWVEIRRGKGQVFLFLAGWEPRESQLALSSKFVPLIYAILGQAGYSATEGKAILTGEKLPLAGDVVTVRLPDGSETERGAGVVAEAPGFYTGLTAEGAARVYPVNLVPAESRTDTIDPAVALADFGVRVLRDSQTGADTAVTEADEQQRLRREAAEKEASQKLWKYLVLAILGILLVETWLAGRRRRMAGGPAVPEPG